MDSRKIARHYFVFVFVFVFVFFITLGNWTVSDWTAECFSSLFCFCLFPLYIIPYLARDSCKKWQENIDKLGFISQSKQVSQRFLVNKYTILDWKRNLFFSIKEPQQTLDIVSCNHCHFLRSMVRKRAFLGCVSQFEG